MKRGPLTIAAGIIAALFLSVASIFYFEPILNAHPLLIGAAAVAFFALLWYIRPFGKAISQWTKPKKISLAIFLPLFSVLAAFSMRGEQAFLLDNNPLVIGAVYGGMFLAVAVASLAAIRFFLSFEAPTGERNVPFYHVFLYMLPMLGASLFMFIAFFPAAMTPDSLAQWEQAKTQEFTDWHPVMFTWTIMLLTKVWDSPGIIALFQIALLSLTMGYLGYLMRRFNVHPVVIWAVLIVAAVMPTSAIFSIIIWKDVTYSVSLVFFSLLLVLLVKTGGEEAKKPSFLILFLLGSFVLVFFRHNGFPVFVITMLFTIVIYRRMWKRLLPAALLIIVLHEVITGPVYDSLEVVGSDPQEALSIPTQQIANIVVNDGDMTDAQREYINRLMPLELWEEKYNPYAVDPIKFSWGDYDRWVIYNDWPGYFKMWGALVVQNPGLAIEAFLKEASLVWQINQPEDGYMNRYVTNLYHGNEFGLVNTVIHPFPTRAASSYLKVDSGVEEVIWRPALYTFLTVLLFYIAYVRNNWRVWLMLLPVALNTAAVAAAIPAQDFRYLYGNPLFFFAAIFIALLAFAPKGGGRLERH